MLSPMSIRSWTPRRSVRIGRRGIWASGRRWAMRSRTHSRSRSPSGVSVERAAVRMADRVTPPNSNAIGGGLDVDSVETNAPPESVSQDGGAGGLLPLRTSVRMAGKREGRVGDWRAGLGRSSCSLLARSEPLPGNTGGDLGLREPVHEMTTDSLDPTAFRCRPSVRRLAIPALARLARRRTAPALGAEGRLAMAPSRRRSRPSARGDAIRASLPPQRRSRSRRERRRCSA